MSPDAFLCDEMLRRLGRWLRAAGYDTEIAGEGLPDRLLLARAAAEGRLLLTRDRVLALAGPPVLLCGGASLAEQAAELKRAAGIDWLKAPFTRCLVDNRPLEAAGAGDLPRLPDTARTLPGAVRLCPECGRLYWPGSHVRRMQARLTEWASLNP